MAIGTKLIYINGLGDNEIGGRVTSIAKARLNEKTPIN